MAGAAPYSPGLCPSLFGHLTMASYGWAGMGTLRLPDHLAFPHSLSSF